MAELEVQLDPGARAVPARPPAGTGAPGPDAASGSGARAPRATRRRVLVVAVFVVIVAGAAAVRLAALGSQPGGLYPDEAAEGVTAHRILTEPGYHPLFISEDAGREPLYAYLVVPAFAVFGESTLTLRSVSAVLGILGVLAIGLALRRFGTGVALVAMAWAGGSLWLISISRDGMRNVLVPLVGALAVAALLHWSHRPGPWSAALAGAAAGAGLWTYQPLKLLPLLVILWLWLLHRQNREAFSALAAHVKWCIGGYLIVGGPMLFIALTEPANYLGRAAQTSLFNVGNGQESLLVHTVRTLGQFVFFGDPNPRQNVASIPLLNWPLVALAVVGVLAAWRRRREPAYLLLLLGVPVFLVPPLLATEGAAPHFLRNLGLAPYIGGLIGLGAVVAVRWVARQWATWGRLLGVATVATVLVLTGISSAAAYFGRPVRDRYTGYTFALVALAKAADHGPHTAVITDDYSVLDVQFLDDAHPPTVFAPGARIADPTRFALLVASSRHDLARAVSDTIARRAVATAFDPAGKPVVWTVVP